MNYRALSDKWRTVQKLLQELRVEDAEAVHMHNTARFDAFEHGIGWARGMADYHERQDRYTPEMRELLRQADDAWRAQFNEC